MIGKNGNPLRINIINQNENVVRFVDGEDEMFDNIISIISDFEFYNTMEENINIILKGLVGKISRSVFDSVDIIIYLDKSYIFGIDYFLPNYPLMSFGFSNLMISNNDCVVVFDNNLQLDLGEMEIKNFVEIN